MRRLVAVAAGILLLAGTVVIHPAAAAASSASSVRRIAVGAIEPGASRTVTVSIGTGTIAQASAGGYRVVAPGFVCGVAVVDTTYQRNSVRVRTFSVTMTNEDAWACDTVLYIALLSADRSTAFGDLAPNQSRTTLWHDSQLGRLVYVAGVTPNAPAAGVCALRVEAITRAAAGGELQFLWRIRNIGTISCGGEYHLGWLPVDDSHASGETYDPGDTDSVFTGGSRSFRVMVVGLQPVPGDAGNCDFMPVKQVGYGDPATLPQPNVDYTFRNSGRYACELNKSAVAFIA